MLSLSEVDCYSEHIETDIKNLSSMIFLAQISLL